MLQNIVDFKAKSFLTEQNTSTMAYEVKAVRALWDPSLSIPGTNRRGGWRCPVGTRYGGQITDRFGRSCGWGVARRIANQISDIGQRLESVDDARRGRRIARRERRILQRLNPEGGGAGRLEQGLRGVAERLDGGDAPSPRGARRRTVVARPPSVDAPDTPRELTPAPSTPRAPRRRRAPNLRESEQRRMDREIEQPGAPRTGEVPARRPRRPAQRQIGADGFVGGMRRPDYGRDLLETPKNRPGKFPQALPDMKEPAINDRINEVQAKLNQGQTLDLVRDRIRQKYSGKKLNELTPEELKELADWARIEGGKLQGIRRAPGAEPIVIDRANNKGQAISRFASEIMDVRDAKMELDERAKRREEAGPYGDGNFMDPKLRNRPVARPQGGGNLRESEQRRMDREIAQPGAPRTGEAPARRRRRAVVETSKTPKAPTQQEAKPKPQVEPKVVKPRRPTAKPKAVRKPQIELDTNWTKKTNGIWERDGYKVKPFFDADGNLERLDIEAPDGGQNRMLYGGDQSKDEINGAADQLYRMAVKLEAGRRAQPEQQTGLRQVSRPGLRRGVNIGQMPQGFRETGEGRWESRDWRVQQNVDRDGNPVGLTAQSQLRPREVVSGKDWDELVAKINRAERIHAELQRGDNDNAARSEEMRQNREAAALAAIADAQKRQRAKGKGKEVDIDNIIKMNDRNNMAQYMAGRVLNEQRLQVINDSDNFPSDRERLQIKAREAKSRIVAADARLEKIQSAINRGALQENDYIEVRGRRIKVSQLKDYISSHRDGWQEVLDQIGSYGGPNNSATSKSGGWTRGPGTIMTHQNGDIIDKTIGGKWFVVYGRPGETKTGFDNREEAIAWHKENVLKSDADRAAIDAPFLTPKAVQNASVPKALKFEQQVADVAKFSTENQAVVEQALLEFKDPKNLANFVLAADAHIFNENEGRQGAIRDFNDLILREVEKYEQNPQQYGDLKTKLEEIQRTYYRLLNRNLGTKAEIENKLLQLKSAQRRYWGFLANPTGDNDALKESVRLQAMIQLSEAQGQIGQFEQGMKLVEKLEAEIGKGIQRKEQGMFFNPDAANVVKPLDEDVAKKIKSQIDVAIERRQGKLAKYLKKRDPNNTAKYVDMTKEKFDALTNNEKIAYLEEAYGHPRIEGANGKLYSATARVSGFNRTFSVSVTFHEIDKDGNKLRQVGTSERSISSAKVYNASMFIGSVLDRGADIQTIYNQHAFLYLKKMGITKAGVTAAQDGQYVWPRIGFKSPNPLRSLDLSPLQKELKFFEKFGAGGLVSSEAEYMRIKSILDQARRGKTFTHQEIIFAIDDPVGNKPRGEFVKQWFISNMRSSGGYLSFADQKIGKRFGGATRAPRRRNPR